MESIAAVQDLAYAAPMIRINCLGVPTDGLEQSAEVQAAFDCFTRHGYALLDNIIPRDRIQSLEAEFLERYRDYLQDREADDSLEVGKRRFMMPLHFSGDLGDLPIFANPYVIAVVRRILGTDAILEAFGAILSLCGSEAQYVHRDGPNLFESEISVMLPAHALTFALPLVEMNEETGTTALWPGSHRRTAHDPDLTPERPVVPPGSCLMWDFRLYHGGTANKSARHRPMVYCTYARRWYQDPVNFSKATQRRLVFEPGFLESVPDGLRPLFAHVTA